MRRLPLLLVSILIPHTLLASVKVVHWQGNYGTASTTTALNLSGYSVTDSTIPDSDPLLYQRNWAYSEATPLNPQTSYTAPTGRTSKFYGALQTVHPTAASTFSIAEVAHTDTGSQLRIANSTGTAGHSIAGLIYFKKEDFLDGGSSLTLSLGPGSSFYLSAPVNGMNASPYRAMRMAVQQEGQWYISATVFNSSLAYELSNPAETLWAPWDPSGTITGIYGANPASFTIAGSTFQNLSAVGFAFEIGSPESAATAPRFAYVNHIEIHLDAIPEPHTTALFGLAGGAFLLYFRNRRSVSR